MKFAILFFSLACLAAPFSAHSTGEIEYYSPAGISFPTLAVPVGVRAIGMGDAYTAAGNDLDALNWNPAGLAKVAGYQLGLADNEWATALGIRQDYVVYGQSVGQSSGFGVSLNYFGLGQLDERDTSGVLQGQSSASIFGGSVGYGWSMLAQDRLKLGLGLEFDTQSFGVSTQTDFGGNLGLVYDLTREFSAGLSINHIGTGENGFSPPEAVSVGISTLQLNHNLLIDVDGQVPLNSEPMINAGFELNLSVLSLRGGYRQAIGAPEGDVQSGPTAGAGFKVGLFRLDYAFVPYGGLSTVNRVQVTVQLPNDFFQPRVIGTEATTTTAKAYYDKALSIEKSGGTMEALVQYNLCVESYPQKLQDMPQQFFITAKQRITELGNDINKHGDNGQIGVLTKKYFENAKVDIAAHRYNDAIEQLRAAKEIDPKNQSIDSMMKEARFGLEDRLKTYRNAARVADKQDHLPVVIDNYKKLLSEDPTDPEALAFFNNHRKEIQSMLQTVHRKGIDQYVSGKVAEAVKIWTLGEALDYWGDIDFKRDIDKAKKLLDLRGQK